MKILKEKNIISKILLKYRLLLILIGYSAVPLYFANAFEKINNPLGTSGPQDIPSFIQTILNSVLVVGVPIVTLAIIYTGFLFVTAQGNSEALTKAKKTLLYTLIGAALLLGSFVISKAIKGTVDEIIKSS